MDLIVVGGVVGSALLIAAVCWWSDRRARSSAPTVRGVPGRGMVRPSWNRPPTFADAPTLKLGQRMPPIKRPVDRRPEMLCGTDFRLWICRRAGALRGGDPVVTDLCKSLTSSSCCSRCFDLLALKAHLILRHGMSDDYEGFARLEAEIRFSALVAV